jgi:riboflavin kinase/FMN adenylyltransferase
MTGSLALGSFDGLHLGHRQVIDRAAARGPAGVLCFEPLPRQLFGAPREPLRLTAPMERLALLRAMGVHTVVWPFDGTTAAREPEEFLDRAAAVCGGAGIECGRIVAGYDFHFGRGRSGGPELLSDWCRHRGMEAVIVGPVRSCGDPVKSSRIRKLIRRGDTEAAAPLLGRDYGVRGPVARGRGHGRKLGFRTLNVRVPAAKLLPAPGSYAARLRAPVGPRDGVAFVPEGTPRLLELHVPGFDGLPYGTVVDVAIGRFVARPEKGLGDAELSDKIATELKKAMEVCRRWR